MPRRPSFAGLRAQHALFDRLVYRNCGPRSAAGPSTPSPAGRAQRLCHFCGIGVTVLEGTVETTAAPP
jgi:hypothetical protein